MVRLLSKLFGNVKLVEISGNFRYLIAKRTAPYAVAPKRILDGNTGMFTSQTSRSTHILILIKITGIQCRLGGKVQNKASNVS